MESLRASIILAVITYSQMSFKRHPQLLIFRFFSNPPPDLIWTPRSRILEKMTVFTDSSSCFLSFLVLFTPNFQVKIACSCIHFSCMRHYNLLLFFSSLCNHVRHFLNSNSPFIKVRNLFRLPPPLIWLVRVGF